MRKGFPFLACLFMIVGGAASLTWGQAPEDKSGRLGEQVRRLQAELDLLRRQIETPEPEVALRRNPIRPTVQNSSSGDQDSFLQQTVSQQSGLGRVLDPDRYPTVEATGFFHLDAAAFSQDAANRATLNANTGLPGGDLQDGIGFRRARPALKGALTRTISYILEMDFAASQPLFVDVWADFSEVPALGNVRIGRWRQPFGMAELTSVREMPFLERAILFALAPFRQTGIGFYDHSDDQRATWALSAISFASDNFGNAIGDNGGWGLTGRLTALPYYKNDGDRLIHLGFDYMFADPGQDRLTFATPPELQVGQSSGGLLQAPFVGIPNFVDTGSLPTRNVNLFGLEAAGAMGRLSLQSELRWAAVRQLNGKTATFPGAYAQARYILTGEQLPYKKDTGVFGQITPREPFDPSTGGLGAWEVAARWSWLDLTEADIPGSGGRMHDLTIGLNWYLNQYLKFQFNYFHVFLDDPALGDSDADIFAGRMHVAF